MKADAEELERSSAKTSELRSKAKKFHLLFVDAEGKVDPNLL